MFLLFLERNNLLYTETGEKRIPDKYKQRTIITAKHNAGLRATEGS